MVARTICLAVALLISQPAWSQLEPGCPAHIYMGNNPNGTDWPDWSEQAQGVANDGVFWFFTHNDLGDKDSFPFKPKGSITKYRRNWYPDDDSDPGKLAGNVVPDELRAQGIWHFGDPDHFGGYIFVPFEGSGPLKAVIGVYRASNLEFVDWQDIEEHQPKASWLAFDPVERLMYSSTDRLVAGTPLLRYGFDLSKLEDNEQGGFLFEDPLMHEIDVQDFDGGEVEGIFKFVQGGVFTPWSDLYLIAGEAGHSPEEVRGGIHLFRRTADGRAFRLIESSENRSVSIGTEVFAYPYDPSGPFASGEEPEGIDWWNQDNREGRYAGQLHAILLDNQLGDDQIWLKHYQVDYFCMEGVDSDGDGISDWDEVYADNTHPFLNDSDLDGFHDDLDNCPYTSNADQADYDLDGLGDICDSDADGDGQSNEDENLCGSDALDSSSLALDLDTDNLPDCVDPDDDGDGQSDEDELACGSDPLDAVSTSPDFDGDSVLDCLDPDDDNDGVDDEGDLCAGTLIPDPVIPSSGVLKRNRYALVDGDFVFDRNVAGNKDSKKFTTTDTAGCNATQIADEMRVGKSHYSSGLSKGILEAWLNRIAD